MQHSFEFFSVQQALQLFIEHFQGLHGMAAFVFVYALCVVLMIPASPLTLFAGVLYGFWPGFLLALLGSQCGACVSFILGRRWLHKTVQQRFGQATWLRVLKHALKTQGLYTIILIRLAVFIPFAAANYGLALTAVSLRTFAAGSVLGACLPTALYVYVASAFTTLAHAFQHSGSSNAFITAIELSGLVIVLLLWHVMRQSSKQLKSLS